MRKYESHLTASENRARRWLFSKSPNDRIKGTTVAGQCLAELLVISDLHHLGQFSQHTRTGTMLILEGDTAKSVILLAEENLPKAIPFIHTDLTICSAANLIKL